jgi:N-acetylneuraminic acid mutarotase
MGANAMKYLIYLFAIIIISSFNENIVFAQQGKLPIPMVYPKILQNNGKIYVITQGWSDKFESKFNIQNSIKTDTPVVIYEFKPAYASFNKITDAPFVRDFFGACISGSKIIIAGGYNSQMIATKTVYEFDLSTQKWSIKKQMINARAYFTLENISSKIYAIGGENVKNECEVFSPESNKWTAVPLKYKQTDNKLIEEVFASTEIENKIYLFGKNGNNFKIFSPLDNSITSGIAAPVNSEEFCIASFSKRIYVTEGKSGDEMKSKVYMLDLVQNNWSTVGKIPFPRIMSGLLYYNGMLMYLGGSTKINPIRPTDEIYIYRPMK